MKPERGTLCVTSSPLNLASWAMLSKFVLDVFFIFTYIELMLKRAPCLDDLIEILS